MKYWLVYCELYTIAINVTFIHMPILILPQEILYCMDTCTLQSQSGTHEVKCAAFLHQGPADAFSTAQLRNVLVIIVSKDNKVDKANVTHKSCVNPPLIKRGQVFNN